MAKLNKIKLNDYKPLREVIFTTLRDAIISGELKPGERLMEVTLAEKMGVSRTPVREAIRKLELEGLVSMIPRKGTHVAELSVKDIIDVLEVRAALDKLATQLAAKKIKNEHIKSLENVHRQFINNVEKENLQGAIKKDIEFHEIIYQASGNSKLISTASNIREQIQRFRVIYLNDFSNTDDVRTEHDEILYALRIGDPELAGSIAEKHIRNQQDTILKSVER